MNDDVEIEWPDPVFERDKNWFFYDETWSDCFGPFASEEDARIALASYLHWLNTGERLE